MKKLVRWSALFLLAAVCVLLFRQAGSYLVKADLPQNTDAIVVLMGSIPDRVLHAADLFKQGIAPRIIIVEPEHGAWDKVIAKGINPIFGAKQYIEVAVQLGIPDSCITIIPGEAQSTKQEAQIISTWLKQNPGLQSLTLVSSNSHMCRAELIFRKKFKKDGIETKIFLTPSPYTKQNDLTKWWTNREKIEVVMFEWVKIVVFLVVEQWTI